MAEQPKDVVVAQSQVIKEFIRHPGMVLLTEKLKEKLKARERAWLTAKSPEEAEEIRQDARAYGLLMGTLKIGRAHV